MMSFVGKFKRALFLMFDFFNVTSTSSDINTLSPAFFFFAFTLHTVALLIFLPL